MLGWFRRRPFLIASLRTSSRWAVVFSWPLDAQFDFICVKETRLCQRLPVLCKSIWFILRHRRIPLSWGNHLLKFIKVQGVFAIILLNFREITIISNRARQDGGDDWRKSGHHCYLAIPSDNWIFANLSTLVKKELAVSTDPCATPQGTALVTEVFLLTLLLLALDCMER